jgi:hypothetical protein
MPLSLHYQAAKLAMGKLNADEIKATIHALVDGGFYLDDFLDALDSSRPRLDEVLPGLLAAFSHYGIVVPDKEQAVWILIEHHLKAITAGDSDPLEQLSKLIADVYWDYDFHTPTKEYLGDSHGIEHLIGAYWEADDLRENATGRGPSTTASAEEWAELRNQVVLQAKRWLATRGDA